MSLTTATLCCALFGAAIICGQEPVPSEAVQPAARLFHPDPAESTLVCEVRPLAPVLTYRLVYRAGYAVTVPMEQLADVQRTLKVLVRVTPKRAGAQPLLLRDTEALPDGSGGQARNASKFEAQLSGAFYLGEGEYLVELVLIGGPRRVCRKQWDLEFKERKGVKALLPPGALAAASQLDLPRPGARPGSATILMNTDNARPAHVLLESLASIVGRLAFSHVEVVAFSLDDRKLLVRQRVERPADLFRIADAVKNQVSGTVSYETLQNQAGHRDFLWQLVAKEGLRAPPADIVIFLGYTTFDDPHVFVPPARTDGSLRPFYVYFDYVDSGVPRYPRRHLPIRLRNRPYNNEPGPPAWDVQTEPGPMGPLRPDAISRVTRACSGKVFRIYSPADLFSALEKTDGLLSVRSVPTGR
jgi:hypothetical protein